MCEEPLKNVDDKTSVMENNVNKATEAGFPVDTCVIVWDEMDWIQHVPEGKTFHFIKEYLKGLPNEVTWTSLFDEYWIQTIRQHFFKSSAPLRLSNVTFEKKMHQPYMFDVEITKVQIGTFYYFMAYIKRMDYFYDWLAKKEKQNTISQLAAGLVHEIKNPLTSIKGFLQLLQAGVAQKQEYYQVMIQEVEKLHLMTNQLLTVGKSNENPKKIESVSELVSSVIFLMELQTYLYQVAFNVEMEDNLYVYGNAGQIQQVLLNFIKNGVEAMNDEGIIQINAYQTGDQICVRIKDEGTGFKSDVLKEARTPFYTTKEDGTGLGLVIVEHILRSHNGHYTIQPNSDKGVTVSIFLPVVVE